MMDNPNFNIAMYIAAYLTDLDIMKSENWESDIKDVGDNSIMQHLYNFDGDKLLFNLVLYINDTHVELADIFIDHEYRRKGMFKKLLKKMDIVCNKSIIATNVCNSLMESILLKYGYKEYTLETFKCKCCDIDFDNLIYMESEPNYRVRHMIK